MDEQLEFLQLVVARLEAAQIPYMLTDSLALAIHALPRMTRDIALVIDASDTSPAARAQLATLYAARSPGARLRMATSLFGTAKRLAIARIRRSADDLDEIGVRAALFDRLHGKLFSNAERAAILSR